MTYDDKSREMEWDSLLTELDVFESLVGETKMEEAYEKYQAFDRCLREFFNTPVDLEQGSVWHGRVSALQQRHQQLEADIVTINDRLKSELKISRKKTKAATAYEKVDKL